jgi:hypothetical protein
MLSVKYWEIIADNLSKAGLELGCVSAVDSRGRIIFVADAHRGENQHFVVRADELLSAFWKLERAVGEISRRLLPLGMRGSSCALPG